LPRGAESVTTDTYSLPDLQTVGQQVLVLNGVGLRKATFFKVKVYAAGLYLEKKTKSAEEILAAPGPKKVVMQFLRTVSSSSIREAWDSSFEKFCQAQACDSIRPDIQKLKDLLPEMKEGMVMSYTFTPEKTLLEVQGSQKGEFSSGLFARALLSAWIGPQPPNPELKDGLLGL
jgi:hypothetical protein